MAKKKATKKVAKKKATKKATKKKPVAKATKKKTTKKKTTASTGKPTTVAAYIAGLPADRSAVVKKLRATVKSNLPDGFVESINYGMIGYVVPHKVYPSGYHCNPELPLPFANIASQKNFVAFYHMGIYADKKLLDWFVKEFPKHTKQKLDMGKSCIRFKKIDDIPYELIGKLMTKVSVPAWIRQYEKNYKKK